MKHKHHIIPKHSGGTDDPSNLIELTVEEHAEAHRLLWEKYGKREDYIAWVGLSKSIGKEEIIKLVLSMAGKKSSGFKGKSHSIDHMNKLKEINTGNRYWSDRKHKEESKKLIGQKNSISQKGKRNSQFGTCWVTNGSENKKIKKEELDIWIELGYYKGRYLAPSSIG